MRHTVVEDHVSFLSRYIGFEECHHQGRAKILLANLIHEQMKREVSLTEVESLLATAITFPEPSVWTRLFYTPPPEDSFIKSTRLLLKTVRHLIEIQTQALQLCADFDKIVITKKTEGLMSLLKEIFNNPCYFSYGAMCGVAAIVQEKLEPKISLQRIFDHLAQVQEPAPLQDPLLLEQTKPRAGSFDAAEPINLQHKSCLALLDKSSKVHDDKNHVCVNANNLLQSVLIIYKVNDERLKKLSSLAQGELDPVSGACAF